jgi:hypothetical protein
VANLLYYEDLDNVVLVGRQRGRRRHGVADRMPQRIAHVVYLDAWVLRDGSRSGLWPPDLRAAPRSSWR